MFYGYLVAAFLVFAATGVEIVWGVKAEQSALESLAGPLSWESSLSENSVKVSRETLAGLCLRCSCSALVHRRRLGFVFLRCHAGTGNSPHRFNENSHNIRVKLPRRAAFQLRECLFR
jgi:hypothetical protein